MTKGQNFDNGLKFCPSCRRVFAEYLAIKCIRFRDVDYYSHIRGYGLPEKMCPKCESVPAKILVGLQDRYEGSALIVAISMYDA